MMAVSQAGLGTGLGTTHRSPFGTIAQIVGQLWNKATKETITPNQKRRPKLPISSNRILKRPRARCQVEPVMRNA